MFKDNRDYDRQWERWNIGWIYEVNWKDILFYWKGSVGEQQTSIFKDNAYCGCKVLLIADLLNVRVRGQEG
jgi:hypothetical protein